MNDLRNEIINLICNFSKWFYSENKKITNINSYKEEILKKIKNTDKIIRIDELMSCLKENDDLIDKYDMYSSDKRGGNGYSFSIENDSYIFGFYNRKDNTSNVILISKDKYFTCSLYIIYELELNKFFCL